MRTGLTNVLTVNFAAPSICFGECGEALKLNLDRYHLLQAMSNQRKNLEWICIYHSLLVLLQAVL